MDVQKEIDKLRKEINYHSKLYYVYDAPVISDYDFDMLMQRTDTENKLGATSRVRVGRTNTGARGRGV